MNKRAMCSHALSAFVFTLVSTGCLESGESGSGGSNEAPAVAPATSASGLRETTSKVDLLFAVDDSSSMADKHDLLRNVIPSLFERLLHPRCVSETGAVLGDADLLGRCVLGRLERPPVTDLHVGVVSSSLGTAGDICDDSPERNRHAELFVPKGLIRNSALHASGDFLAWSQASSDAGDAAPVLSAAFQNFFSRPGGRSNAGSGGIGELGCGIESQLESVYQFLVQPDPYDHYDRSRAGGPVRLGVRDRVLAQRRAFLRPDSLVMVVMISDENDASLDPEMFGGGAARFSSWSFGATPSFAETGAPRITPYSGVVSTKGFLFPKGTASCSNLKDASPEVLAACTTCAVAPSVPQCAQPFMQVEDDAVNTRFVQMRARYGVDALFPVERYVQGLSARIVPQRAEEHRSSGAFTGATGSCTNPLFAAALPGSSAEELCHLPAGTRGAGLVQFALLGGVAPDLVSENGVPKDQLSELEWKHILGERPEAYNLDGIDPRMVELGRPRTAEALRAMNIVASPAGIEELRVAQNAGLSPADAAYVIADSNTNVAGKEQGFGSDVNDVCSIPIAPRPVDAQELQGAGACNRHYDSEACAPALRTASDRKQVRAKVRPTPRLLQVARALGAQALTASLCPSTVNPSLAARDQSGYAPVVARIAERIGRRLQSL